MSGYLRLNFGAVRLSAFALGFTMAVGFGAGFAIDAQAQILVSANDAKSKLVNGVAIVVANPPPDTVTIYDMKSNPPKLLAELQVPNSVIGPPLNVAVTPDEGLALVASAMKIDPADATKLVPDNLITVIDLKANPPKVIAKLTPPGLAPSGLSINRQGTLALVANRSDGTVTVLGISGKTVSVIGSVTIGGAAIGVSHVAISPDGKTALATRDGDSKVSVLSIDGTKVEYTKRDIHGGLRPYGLDISSRGDIAVAANVGMGGGDVDTVSVIDMRMKPPRTVDVVSVAQTLEGIKLSPDGALLALIAHNGSGKAPDSPFYNDFGKLVVYRVHGAKLVKAAEAKIGHWSQGVVISPDNQTILVQNMVEQNIQVFRFNGQSLTESKPPIKLNGGGAGLRIADKPVTK